MDTSHIFKWKEYVAGTRQDLEFERWYHRNKFFVLLNMTDEYSDDQDVLQIMRNVEDIYSVTSAKETR